MCFFLKSHSVSVSQCVHVCVCVLAERQKKGLELSPGSAHGGERASELAFEPAKVANLCASVTASAGARSDRQTEPKQHITSHLLALLFALPKIFAGKSSKSEFCRATTGAGKRQVLVGHLDCSSASFVQVDSERVSVETLQISYTHHVGKINTTLSYLHWGSPSPSPSPFSFASAFHLDLLTVHHMLASDQRSWCEVESLHVRQHLSLSL